MKKYCLILLTLLSIYASGCSLSSNRETPAARPTVNLPPQPSATPEIKSIEGQAAAAPAVDAPLIGYNQIKEGRLNSPQAVDEWVFQAQVGERVNIVLNSQFDGYLELHGPGGEFIASNDDSGSSLNAALFELQIGQSGPHTIIVRGYGGSTGSYALALTGGHPTLGGGTLVGGDSRTVLLSPQGIKWQYQGQQGSYLTITTSAEDQVDAALALYGPDGQLLAEDDDSGGNLNAEIFEVELPRDGRYAIQARTVRGTGLVTLTLASSPQASGGGALTPGKTQVGTLKPGRGHEWSFAGQAGQVVDIRLNSIDFDTFLEVRSSQGLILAENDDGPEGTNSAIEMLTLPADDTYTVIARSVSRSDGGDYDISLKPVKVEVGGGLLAPEQPVEALLPAGQTNTWRFEAEADTLVTAQTVSEQIDTYLELYSPDGRLLIEDDDSGGGLNAAILDFVLPETGEYQLVVRSAGRDSNESGVYSLALALANGLDTAGQLTPAQPAVRSLAAGEQHTWTFGAEEDLYLTIRMESDTLDTYLSLYDDGGELLAVNDDFLGKQAVIANFIVPKSGQYRIVARAYSETDSGDYTISLEISEEELPVGTN